MIGDWIAKRPVAESALVALDGSGTLEALLAERGCRVTAWRRWLAGEGPEARPWPPDGSWECAFVRQPKGREALTMTLHACLARLRPGAKLWLYGSNDEGIRSAGRTLAEVAADVVTVETRRHCRIWQTSADPERPLRGELAAWRQPFELQMDGHRQALVSYPGLFAHGRLDPATRLLLGALPAPQARARVLDFGCGAGAISAVLARRQPELHLTLVDRDTLALCAAAENLPRARVVGATRLSDLAPERFDWIVSNPPLHSGKDTDTGVAADLARGAAAHLREGGALWVVVPRTLPMERWLRAHFRRVECPARSRGAQILCARDPS